MLSTITFQMSASRTPLLEACARVALGVAVIVAFITTGSALPVLAQADAPEGYWVENPSLSLALSPFDPAAAPKDSMGNALPIAGEIYDSADYQTMLLLPAKWDSVYILELATGAVKVYPRAAVLANGESPVEPDAARGAPAGVFVSDPDGRMLFADDRCEVAVGPTPALIGPITRAELEKRLPVYERRAASYRPNPAAVAQIAKCAQQVEIVAFFGTWCSTCKHYLPGLMAAVDKAANPRIRITYVGVDENVTEPADWIARCGVSTTPTVVVDASGREIGRIQNEPKVSMEADLAAILGNGTPQ